MVTGREGCSRSSAMIVVAIASLLRRSTQVSLSVRIIPTPESGYPCNRKVWPFDGISTSRCNKFASKKASARRRLGAGGRTRTGTAISHRGIFIPATAFAASPGAFARRLVCGLDYTFALARSRFRCCPSSLYRRNNRRATSVPARSGGDRDWRPINLLILLEDLVGGSGLQK